MFKKLFFTFCAFMFAFCSDTLADNIETNYMARNQRTKLMTPGMLTSAIQLEEGEEWWGYFDGNFGGKLQMGRGSKTVVPQQYDAAMCIPAGSPILTNKTITGMMFSFPCSVNVKDVKVWIANDYPENIEKETVFCQNVDNITGLEEENDFVNEVRFDKPYVVDFEKDTYIGYSFKIVKNEVQGDRFPIITTSEFEKYVPNHNKGLLVRFGGEGNRWKDCTGRDEGDLAMLLLLTGKTAKDAAGIDDSFDTKAVVKGSKNTEIPVVLQNAGENDIKSYELTVEVNGKKDVLPIELTKPVTGMSTKFIYKLNVNVPEENGYYPVKVTVSKVNGIENKFAKNICQGTLVVVPERAEHKVVLEEITGMWCPNCTRGIVGLENLKKEYGSKVVLVAVHYSPGIGMDPLACNDYKTAIDLEQGAPSANLDRKYFAIDPYYGNKMYGETPMGIRNEVNRCLETIPVATVKAGGVLDGDVLNVTADVNFLYTGPADYALGYVITCDDMKDPAYQQKNGYHGKDFSDDPYLDKMTKEPNIITDIAYNEVAIAAKGINNGIEGSIPENVEINTVVSHSESFKISDYPVVKDSKKLNVCVFLFDKKSGVIVNADQFPLSEAAAIEGVSADDDKSEEIARYSVDGRRIYAPEYGVNIVKYSDGKVKKIVVR